MTPEGVVRNAEALSNFGFVECCICGVQFGSPALLARAEDVRPFWCPNGHANVFMRPEDEKAELERVFRLAATIREERE